jgi:hypothetical protein
MKKLLVSAGVFILGLSLVNGLYAQTASPAGPPRAARMYDPATVETLAGEVVQVNVRTSRRTSAPGMMSLLLKTEKESINVLLGPSWFLDQQNFKLAAGDRVQVTGSRLVRPHRTILVAGEVKKGDQVLKLRDAQGNPLWPRGRR